jgi:cytoskeleton protein RodZ
VQSVDPATAAGVEVVHPVGEATELPGRRLRETREGRGLSVADVAGTLKFSPRQIEALEADDYSSLQGATFVRGFVRSYARYLKLAPEPLLAMLEDRAPIERAVVRPPEDTGVAMPVPGSRRLSPWIAGATLLALVAIGLMVWHLRVPQIPSLEQPTATPANTTPAGTQQQVLAPVPRIEQDAATPDSMAGQPAAAPPPEGRQLVFQFSDKSWLEVRDASQRVILSGEFPGGDRRVAAGKPPFYLWVGRASALRVLDGEREIDLMPHARDDVARLTVE